MTNSSGGAICRRVVFTVPAQLFRHVRVLRYRRYMARVLPGPLGHAGGMLLDGALAAGRHLPLPGRRAAFHVAWSDAVDPRMQTLWEQSEHGQGLCTVRSTRMFEWRFLGLPAILRRFLLVAPAPGAPLLAWFACETNAHAAGLMSVTDAWFAGGVRAADRRAIRELCRMGYEAGCDAIQLRLTAAQPVLDAWCAEGFVTRGQQPFFVHGMEAGYDGDVGIGLHITDIEQDG